MSIGMKRHKAPKRATLVVKAFTRLGSVKMLLVWLNIFARPRALTSGLGLAISKNSRSGPC